MTAALVGLLYIAPFILLQLVDLVKVRWQLAGLDLSAIRARITVGGVEKASGFGAAVPLGQCWPRGCAAYGLGAHAMCSAWFRRTP